MDITNLQRADILTHAVPYIRQYIGKTVVIKYGGSAMQSEELRTSVMNDIVSLSLLGTKVVLVHGGGPEITDMLKKIGKESRFVNGLRVTDEETAEVVQMILAGKINKNLIKAVQKSNGKAVGISGIDGELLIARPISKELEYAGEIVEVNPGIINDLLEKKYIPIISTVSADREGNSYNVNADTAAAKIAAAMNAECLINMTDIDGIMKDMNDPKSLIRWIAVEDAPSLVEDGTIKGGMIPKMQCCVDAVKSGVDRVFIINGKSPHSIIVELFTDEGMGTMFYSKSKGGVIPNE